ncbi:XdhC family protein [Nocardia alni]|uniref:XdhC family protein n=1 Tax=Nocardia alni TaxID=2815723 RepID=UPI003F686228
MRELAVPLARWHAAATPYALATIIGVTGSAPRPVGATMAVNSAGEVAGSLSGGCVEGAVYELCRQALESGTTILETFGYTSADADDFEVGLTCGGRIEVLVHPVRQPQFAIIEAALHTHNPVALVRDVLTGAMRIVGADARNAVPEGSAVLEGTAVLEGSAVLEGTAVLEGSAVLEGTAVLEGSAVLEGTAVLEGSAVLEGAAVLESTAVLEESAATGCRAALGGGVGVSRTAATEEAAGVGSPGAVVDCGAAGDQGDVRVERTGVAWDGGVAKDQDGVGSRCVGEDRGAVNDGVSVRVEGTAPAGGAARGRVGRPDAGVAQGADVVLGEGPVRHTVAVTDGGVEYQFGAGPGDDAIAVQARAMLELGQNGLRVVGCGPEEVTVFVQSFAPPPRMIIFGATDFAAALCRIGRLLGYRVTVCDARPAFLDATRMPDADEIVVAWPHRYLEGTQVDSRTVVCVLTHDPKFDIPVLTMALRLPVAYVGALGARRADVERRTRLLEAGVSEDELSRLRSPIGLHLGGRTPEETAVAIGAEIVAARHGGSAEPLSRTDRPIHASDSPSSIPNSRSITARASA